jgi:ribonuclease D
MSEGQFLPPPTWVDNAEGFQDMLDHLRGEPALAVDTESNSLFVYHEQVCLIQISIPGADYLVDTLALRDLSPLGPLLCDPAVLKVLHGAEYDLIVLHRNFGFTLCNLFDTMWASRILGWPEHGLAALLQAQFGVSLNKKYQRANWGLRPLPPELDYARLDTRYLLPLCDIQSKELTARGRWAQARDRFARLAQTRWAPKGFDRDGFWQMTGVKTLDDTGRGVLCALYQYREQRAMAENVPPFKILANRVLLELSAQRPHDLEGLRRIHGLSPRLIRQDGQGLLAAIRRGARNPLAWEDRPRAANGSHNGSNGRPSAQEQSRFEALRSWRNATAEERGVEPDIVLTNQALWMVVNRNPRSKADLARDNLLAPWQLEEFGNELLAVIRRTP